jgi:predicted RecB family nuclease
MCFGNLSPIAARTSAAVLSSGLSATAKPLISFQWSLHHVDPVRAVTHREFLADPGADPRRAFAETLLAALSDATLPVVVYSSYEKVRLTELGKQFPDLSKQIRRVISRLIDLLPVVRDCIYYPSFGFSNSIKSVAPALSPDVTYDDLEEIANGGEASRAFWQMASGRAEPATWAQIRSALRAYCHRDTWALIELHNALTGLAAQMRKVSAPTN